MAATQPNFATFTYVDNAGHSWNKRGLLDTAQNAIDGSTPFNAGNPTWPRKSRRYSPREAVFQDPTTLRTRTAVIYTSAAAAALTGTSTLAVAIQGEATPISYNFTGLNPERVPKVKTSGHLIDHP